MVGRSMGGELLETVYEELEFDQGRLLEAAPGPTSGDAEWDSIGEWLMLAHRMDAERVFFVGDDPVIVFKRLPASAGKAEILRAYRSAWSLARPHCLFLSTPEQLHIYSLNALPARTIDDADELQPLQIISRAADVAEFLHAYHRDRIESGALFSETPFDSRDGRADTQLLQDVRAANNELVQQGLPATIAHALIERIILIRYLEDREIITADYFGEIASDNEQWIAALQAVTDLPQLGAESAFVSCLTNRELVYSIFGRLEADFNGDLFRVDDAELELVTAGHLELIRQLLTGAGLDPQMRLFLWAYDFDVVPTSLISSMYEQFYRTGAEDDRGTHYTPAELVEFVLARVLPDEVLGTGPRICDPACGSGIFLVEAFRRLVRNSSAQLGRDLTPYELRELLLTKIAGVDVNQEAIRLAAFSLYLAYLNYQSPSDIQIAGPLPRLIHRPEVSDTHAVLAIGDAFSPMVDEATSDGDICLPWEPNSFDVVVGNPPWSVPHATAVQMADKWVQRMDLPVGGRSPSQQFLWRCLSFLRTGGSGAMLIGMPALLNSAQTSQHFRQRWLQQVKLRAVVDFTSVSHLFFSDSAAPFVLVVFEECGEGNWSTPSSMFSYSAIRPSKPLEATGAVAHAQLEHKWVSQEAIASRDYLWKTYAWGNHHDEALMSRLDIERKLAEFLPSDPGPGFGYQLGSGVPSDELSSLPSLGRFDYWGPLNAAVFEQPPEGVKRQPDERRYRGPRIIIRRGVRRGFGPVARFESDPFAFRHTVYCLPMHDTPEWRAKNILGILLSSLGRYRLFMTSPAWGVWHDDLRAQGILDLPVRMNTEHTEVSERIVLAVDKLARVENSGDSGRGLDGMHQETVPMLADVLAELDDAVFELFEVTDAERDLVSDFVTHTLPLVGRSAKWLEQPALTFGEYRRGTIRDLDVSPNAPYLDRYLAVFLRYWNRELEPDGEFSWYTATSPRIPFIAVVLETQTLGQVVAADAGVDEDRWQSMLGRLDSALALRLTASIRTNGTLRSVSDSSIILAKRNEARLWSASAAREDAEATLLQAMNLQSIR